MTVAVLTPEQLEHLVERAVERAVARVGRPAPEAMTSAQAAELAGVTPKTVRTWVESGVLRAQRRGRRIVILRRDLEAHLAGSPQAGPALLSSLTTRSG